MASTGFLLSEFFFWEQLLDVLRGFQICESERVRWYIELEGKSISLWSFMQFSGCELSSEQLIAQKKF